jgi:hypothetical protein
MRFIAPQRSRAYPAYRQAGGRQQSWRDTRYCAHGKVFFFGRMILRSAQDDNEKRGRNIRVAVKREERSANGKCVEAA